MNAPAEPTSPRHMRRRWVLWIGLALLGLWIVRAVKHRFFQAELIHARVDLVAIRYVLEEFAEAHSKQYPADLMQLVTPDEAGKCWLEGYNGRVPMDPWKRAYRYTPPTPTHPAPRVVSFSADGEPGGEGESADVDSEDLSEWR